MTPQALRKKAIEVAVRKAPPLPPDVLALLVNMLRSIR